MALFPFSLRGYAYQKSLDDMRSAFKATMNALYAEHEKNLAGLAAIKTREEAGEDVAEYDENGDFLFLHETAQEMRIDQSEFALRSARNAFVVMLHHLWEKAAIDWQGKKPGAHYKFDNSYNSLEMKGFKLDRDMLEFLRKACNAIKHNNNELYEDYKEYGLFATLQDNVSGIDYASALRLDDFHIEELIDALKASGLHIHSTIKL